MDNVIWEFSGRSFTEEEIGLIKEIVRMYPGLSVTELAKTVCENIGWVTDAGRCKTVVCIRFLEIMGVEGLIQLPEKRESFPKKENSTVKVCADILHKEHEEVRGKVSEYCPITLHIARGGSEDLKRWKAYMEEYHMIGYKNVFGSRLQYFIKSGDKELGCLQFSASAWALAERDRWIGWKIEDRKKRLHLIVNNSRFLIFPWVKIKYLASKALSLAAKRIRGDWLKEYCYAPVLLETFVDVGDYKGTSYKAANWKYVGITEAMGRTTRNRKRQSRLKAIYVYPLEKDFRAYLKGKKPYKTMNYDEQEERP